VRESAVYVARYHWPFRLTAVGLAALVGLLRQSVPAIWRSEGWFLGVGLIFIYILAGLFLLETFIRKTWFTESGIRQRSLFGRTRFISYRHVKELVIQSDEALVVKYGRNQCLKVHAKEGDPQAIIEAARPFLNPEIRVITG